VLSTPLWEAPRPKPPVWRRLFKGYLIFLACFWVVMLFLTFWWDFLPESISFVAPILLFVLALIWLSRKGMITPRRPWRRTGDARSS
jgi:hypothetical protein